MAMPPAGAQGAPAGQVQPGANPYAQGGTSNPSMLDSLAQSQIQQQSAAGQTPTMPATSAPIDPRRQAQYQSSLSAALRGPGGLAGNDWSTLRNLRAQTTDPTDQQALAPAEHQAYAREYVGQNPASYPGMVAAPLGYYAAKKLGFQQGRTPASMDQVWAGIYGANQGLSQALRRRAQR